MLYQKLLIQVFLTKQFPLQGNPAILMLVGLQGSGKTTTIAKLGNYLRKKEAKKPVFGELWNIVKTTNENSEQNPYHGELYEFHIDMEKNIFAA